MRSRFLACFAILFVASQLAAQTPPKREFRAAWIATVTNLDWPASRTLTSTAQQADLIALIDQLADLGINAIIFQVRTECDALYASPYEPWSYWLTGTQGNTPIPYFDPLEVAVAEAHKRGMELHAWFNPYRAERSVNNYALSGQHVVQQHPNWAITIGTFRFLDPGRDSVRQHTLKVVMDVVRRYDVDGVHFDDYFYPYSPNHMTANATNDALDDATYSNEWRGIPNKYDWRRDNVNILFKQLHDSIAAVKPTVKIGISPFGIWRPGYPSGISGMDAYSVIYCDPLAWLRMGSIDYLTPQLYWKIGGSQDYSKLMPWWADSVRSYGRHLYPGQAPYRILDGTASAFTGASEILNQIRLNREPNRALGSVFFRARVGLLDNRGGLTDSLRADLYRTKALIPVMAWKDTVKPNAPLNVRFEPLAGNGPGALQWDPPAPAADGGLAIRYAVYRFPAPWGSPAAPEDASALLAVTGERMAQPQTPDTGSVSYFAVTSLDRNNNESLLSSVVIVAAPPTPALASPNDMALGQPRTVTLQWHREAAASFYRLQVSTDPSFATNIVYDQSSILDTAVSVVVIGAQQQYWWRVRSSNGGGSSLFSTPRSFTTGFPGATTLVSPAHATLSVPIPVRFTWLPTPTATSYQFQLATNSGFSPMVLDTSGVLDTTLVVGGLQTVRYHWWRVRAANSIDLGPWSTTNAFQSGVVVGVDAIAEVPSDYRLEQNYPNPFNPVTTIRFAVPVSGLVTLRVVDVLGREIAVLYSGDTAAGVHAVSFDGSRLPTGVYLCVFQAGDRRMVNRMVLVK